MARKIDKSSTRQQAFARFNELRDSTRIEAIRKVETEFDLKHSYARALYQQYRNQARDKGQLTKVYVVRDVKNNIPVVPYVQMRQVEVVTSEHNTSIADAVVEYIGALEAKKKQAEKLCGTSSPEHVECGTATHVNH